MARRLVGGLAVLVVVPSLTFVFFAATVADVPVWDGLREYLEATFIRFDLGDSALLGTPDVRRLLSTGVAVDVAILAGALLIGIGGGLALGANAAARGGAAAALAHAVGTVALVSPAAVIAYAGIFVAESEVGGYEPLTEDPLAWASALWVPWLAVGLPILGGVLRVSAAATRDALTDDAIRTAHAKGVRERRVLWRHVVPLALPPVAAFGGATVNLIILNAAVVEQIFNLPGSFRYAQTAVQQSDLGLLQGLSLVTVAYVVVGNLLADLLHAYVDPRVRQATTGRRGVRRRPA